MTGTVGPVDNLHPGDVLTVTGTLQLYSQAIISTTDVSTITLDMPDETPWLMLYDDQGGPVPYNGFSGASRLTPSGFPILDDRRPEVSSQVAWQPITWTYQGGNIIAGDLTLQMTLDEDMLRARRCRRSRFRRRGVRQKPRQRLAAA